MNAFRNVLNRLKFIPMVDAFASRVTILLAVNAGNAHKIQFIMQLSVYVIVLVRLMNTLI